MVLRRFRSASTRVWLIAYLLLRAVIITTLGILLLIRPHDTVHRVAAFAGWVLIVLAVIDALAAVSPGPDRVTRRLLWVRATLTAVVGLVLALLTTVSVTAVAVLLAMYLVVTGGVNMILGLHLRSEVKAWMGMTVRGGLALIAGVSALVWPSLTIVVVAMILGVHWVVGGLVSVSTAVGVWLESRGPRGESEPKPSAPTEEPAETAVSTPKRRLRLPSLKQLVARSPSPSEETAEMSSSEREPDTTSPSEGDADESPEGGGVETLSDEREDVSLEDR